MEIMTNKQARQIRNVSKWLISLFKKKYKHEPFSLFINAWQDGDFQVYLSSSMFPDGKQKDEVKKGTYRVLVFELEYHSNREGIREKLTEEWKKKK